MGSNNVRHVTMSLPTGTVTFLFTDIEGSTRLRESGGRAFEAALALHHRLLRALFAAHSGHEVKELGDGFIAAFEHPTDAVACAVAAQLALADLPFRVRTAVHTGEVELDEGDYRGLTLHHSARLLSTAHGGQVLCSEGTAVLLARGLDPTVRLVDLGAFKLRDVSTPERLFHVCYPGMPTEPFPPPLAEPAHGSQLPPTLTRFFGREAELAWLHDTLLRDDIRLITMTGPGGSGKTRLSIEVARTLLDPFRGAVWFVPLQEIRDASLLGGAIADAMGLPRSSELDPFEQAVAALSKRPALLVLDNFEHVVDDGAQVVRALLERARMTKCLVTSRRTLDLSAEIEYFLSPLSTPGADPGIDAIRACESVRLFVDRARAARPDFEVTPDNARAVGELCERLEGIPLALELAAVRAQVLTPAQMLVQLDHRLDFLATHKRDVPVRHRTLRAAIDWSYESLPGNLQRFFTRLSVFRGGWTIEAAQGVCDAPLALEHLERLRECSLVLLDTDPTDATRFRLLETLREYADAQLTDADRAELRARHARFWTEVAELASDHIYSGQHRAILARFDADYDNLRAALQWALTHEPDVGLRLAIALEPYWTYRVQVDEMARLADAILAAVPNASPELRGLGLAAAGHIAWIPGGVAKGGALLEEALLLLRGSPSTKLLARALGLSGLMAAMQGDVEAARARLEEALSVNEALGDLAGVAWMKCELANLIARSPEGDQGPAVALLHESVSAYRESGFVEGAAYPLANLGRLAYLSGDLHEARECLEEASGLHRAASFQRAIAVDLFWLGDVLVALGEIIPARECYTESLSISLDGGVREHAVLAVRGLGKVAGATGQPLRLARLYGAARAVMERLGVVGTYASADALDDDFVSSARAALGEEAFAAAWAEGRAMSWEDAVAYALASP